ncbi:MAG: 3-isopropylmalate dehydrogenase [Chlamydiae bacterium]|nr:3-isopropylmalate dehydrogenase [Chlamydiota bacterium]
MNYKIAVLAGDGIGPEVMDEAIKVLKTLESKSDISFSFEEGLVGGSAWQVTKSHLPKETIKICENSQAILFGSVGGPIEEADHPKWSGCEINSILALRKHFNFFINIRPLKLFKSLNDHCILKESLIRKGFDILCLRELSEGIYFGKKETKEIDGQRVAFDQMFYTEGTIEKIAHRAFEIARTRKKKVTSVDKANVLECGKLWREVVTRVSKEYPECTLEHLLVDNASMQLILRPSEFDVLLCPNMFGDILSDEVSVFTGSLGMLASASINKEGFGLYEPPGGSAYDLAGLNVANPIGQILSAALMLKISFGLDKEHDRIVNAVEEVLSIQYRTGDIYTSTSSCKEVSTEEMGDAICKLLK